MHMGAAAVIGTSGVRNLIHIVINNGSHESVGGFPTAADNIHLAAIARECGYSRTVTVYNVADLDHELALMKELDGVGLIEIKCAVGSRKDLGRPTTTPLENKNNFMSMLERKN